MTGAKNEGEKKLPKDLTIHKQEIWGTGKRYRQLGGTGTFENRV